MIFTVDSITGILHIPPLCPWSTILGSHVDLTLFSFCVTPPSWHPINYQVLPKYLLNVNPSSLHLYSHHLRSPSCLSGLWSLTHSPNGHHRNLCKMLAQSSHSCASNTLRKSHFLMEDSNSLVPSSLTSSPSTMYIVLWLLRYIEHVVSAQGGHGLGTFLLSAQRPLCQPSVASWPLLCLHLSVLQ